MLEDRFEQTLSTDSDAAVDEYIRGVDLLVSSNLGALAVTGTWRIWLDRTFRSF